MHNEVKHIVSVAEMARMVGLSRARFYQLIGSTFPFPIYDVATHRPFYNAEQQEVCLEVRKRNCGINGRPILFYSRRGCGSPPMPRTAKQKEKSKQFAFVVDGVRALGMQQVNHDQVTKAIKQLYPNGNVPSDAGELIRAVFVHLMRQNQGDSVGR